MAKNNKKPEYKIINVKNKRAYFDYEITDKYTCGMVLLGTEIKSIRLGRTTLGEAHCYLNKNELFVKNMNISPYEQGNQFNHTPTRERKLLLNKNEINKIRRKLEEKGLTIIPLRLFINDRGFAKMEIGVGKGKKLHDKRQSLKENESKKKLKAADY